MFHAYPCWVTGDNPTTPELRKFQFSSTSNSNAGDNKNGAPAIVSSGKNPDARPSTVPLAEGRGTPAQRRHADTARGGDGTEWVAVGELSAQSPDGPRRRLDLDARTRGTVHWIQPDPYTDPANADVMARISVPMPRPRLSDETAGQ
ncbi:hypothetical protein CA951_18545 [Rhodococcus sp. NCIMB 12038]|nr:hypothetical protein CA951_18545 [Rhodococcus sp. NCIMB 12038]